MIGHQRTSNRLHIKDETELDSYDNYRENSNFLYSLRVYTIVTLLTTNTRELFQSITQCLTCR